MSDYDDYPFVYGYVPVSGNESRLSRQIKGKGRAAKPPREPPEQTPPANQPPRVLYRDQGTAVYFLIFKPPRGHWYQWSLGLVNGNNQQWKLFEALQDQTDEQTPTERQTWNYWEADPRVWDGFVDMFLLTRTRVSNLGDMHRMALRLQEVARPDLNSQAYVIEFGHKLREANLCTHRELENIWQVLEEYHGRQDDDIGFEREREHLLALEHLQPPDTSQFPDDEFYGDEIDPEMFEDFEQLQYGVRDFGQYHQDRRDLENFPPRAGPSRLRVEWELQQQAQDMQQQLEEPRQKRLRRD
ncbi:hypothetical protein AK830_g10299 [Neonectria ditissima]|uniref:Uncharacterized protein n=1 Tax=Neonectria ditissima TaxID=78410 RepID=A0A0P7BAR0_9HYPO|nr:hypothetical protein AK830_g10299 [Neonectria ditissima]